MNLLPIAVLFFSMVGVNVNVSAGIPIVLETDTLALTISHEGQVTQFLDRFSGVDYFDHTKDAAFAVIRQAGRALHPTDASYENGSLAIQFEGGGSVVFRVSTASRWLSFEVESLGSPGAEELIFAGMPLTVRTDREAPFAVSPLAANLKTNCSDIPGLCSSLTGFIAYDHFGFQGARGIIIGCPASEMRETLKLAVKASPELVSSPLGGPWALDAEINRGSYLIAADEHVTEANVIDWIGAARAVGATQIDLHGGKAFRWGDGEINRDIYPRGRESLKAVVDAMHGAGISAGLHTYAFFIAKDTPWVTPVPDPDLDVDKEFRLAKGLESGDVDIAVEEDTRGMSAVTGFQLRNSATLRIGDELITYAEVATGPPFGFKGCIRGAYGTRVATHPEGSPVFHLKECFGLFVPRGDSELFNEVARQTADLYNACGFDMLYLDALDGADILAGGENAWHYGTRFVFELMRHLEKPPVMEMSTFSHHLWCVRSRMQAWDCPARGAKQFVDIHIAQNEQWKKAFLPTHLGWWGLFPWSGIQPERTTTEDLEYLFSKAIGTDSSVSYITGVTPQNLKKEYYQRLAEIARKYESLRLEGTVSDSVKAQLSEPGKEFKLEASGEKGWLFRPCVYDTNIITSASGGSSFVVKNPFGKQNLKVRIEVPLVMEEYDSAGGKTLAAWDSAPDFGPAATQPGVTASMSLSLERTPDGEPSALVTAGNASVEPARAWAVFEKQFDNALDLAGSGLGVWVAGDGQGAVLNLQLRASIPKAGGIADHYIPLDFSGWRYFTLVEPESGALSAYEWRHTRLLKDLLGDTPGVTSFAYPMYHIWVDYSSIASLTVGLNNVPVGKTVQVRMGPVKALPLSSAKLINPSMSINGKSVMFPVELESGSYLEFQSFEECRVYDGKGNFLEDIAPVGKVPVLCSGENVCRFESAAKEGSVPRAKVTVNLCCETPIS